MSSSEGPLLQLSWPTTTNEALSERAGDIAEILFDGEHTWDFGESPSADGPIFGVSMEDRDVVVTIDAAVNYVSVANVRLQHTWPDHDIGLERARAQCEARMVTMREYGFVAYDVECSTATTSTTTVGIGNRSSGQTRTAESEYRFTMRHMVDGVVVGNTGVILGIAAETGALSSFSVGGAAVEVARAGRFVPPAPNPDTELALLRLALGEPRAAQITGDDGVGRAVLGLQDVEGELHITFDEWMYLVRRGVEPRFVEPRRVVVFSVGVGLAETRSRIVAISRDGQLEEMSDRAEGGDGGGDVRR